MSAGMRSLDDIMAAGRGHAGVTAVLDAANRVRSDIEWANYQASFAPAPEYYASCMCGSVMQVMGELDGDDYVAIEDWNAQHAECQDRA
jgi:hypothetical protein